MKIESLANELLLDLFEFLNGAQLLRAFSGLNYRFDNLLLTHFHTNPLDFGSVSKTDFDIVCQHHLPSIADQIISLRLSDDEETPQQTRCFLAHNLILDQFIHLQSLSLSHIDSDQIMDKTMNGLSHLYCLERVNITNCNFRSLYIDSIWRLPRLIDCKLNSITNVDWFAVPTVISLSLQNLSILHSICEGVSLERISKYTPHLQCLAVDLVADSYSPQLSYLISSIQILKLSLKNAMYGLANTIDGLNNILQRMPNLFQLTVETWRFYVDGFQWEKMITNHLPKLKVFQLLMQFEFDDYINSREQTDEILDTFRTHFWIDEHRWFVRCHWNRCWSDESYSYCLYTLPYVSPSFEPDSEMQFKSTCFFNKDSHSYDRVRYVSYGPIVSSDFLLLHFSKVHHLDLDTLISTKCWFAIPTFDRLTSLTISFSAGALVLLQLQSLLNRAPFLSSLSLNGASTSLAINLKSRSICRLYLKSSGKCFDEQTCTALSRSPLGIQCEVLSIEVEDPTNIVYLVNSMKNLRALSIQYSKDTCVYENHSDSLLSTKDKLDDWLQQRLPATCLISRDTTCYDRIKLWIR